MTKRIYADKIHVMLFHRSLACTRCGRYGLTLPPPSIGPSERHFNAAGCGRRSATARLLLDSRSNRFEVSVVPSFRSIQH
ncbi:hypothetical protein PVAP13_5NG121016 [Panicum virgatum]|uniref:Uncharacterized protein n=1 Tax=Panicum virgatum TaxID=38727 RepID=A0A8T0RKM0_PANVG|nr:hypothetical protein PVAP13_5NG121016 [Panicum virgatum]